MSFDDREIRELSVSLGRVPAAMVAEAAAIVAKGSVNIKTDARSRVSDHPTWKRLESTITFEQVGLTSTIGYEDRGQGELAGIAEFGSALHAPHPALIPAANAEAPKFTAAMGAAAAKALRLL